MKPKKPVEARPEEKPVEARPQKLVEAQETKNQEKQRERERERGGDKSLS